MISHPSLRVVIADDEPDLRLLLRMQLDRHQDFEVVGEAADGSQAVEQVKRTDAEVVVMDLLMPGTSGFEAIAMLAEQAPTVGIVAYTAVAGDFVRTEMKRIGVELVLKSGDIGPLADALRRAAPASVDS
ncbi:two component transcriptional regulator, LuxR family [Euzebya pacifica]|uniref:Two component transcriptional regulator, LuxR family n=1 Tax=Euzebya pacifica TaxID=1608957 RepID=A0A346Y0M1_9ACTN|nr:response regulator transcription factor [Euzebya pacifica]AXV08018.1 two component transcriptional regulator, LuxR family [Euzebya pacifica]